MTRTRLTGIALLLIVLLPGCGIFANRPGLCNRNRGQVNASPVVFPGGMPAGMPAGMPGGDPGCGSMVIPNGTPPYPVPGFPGQMETFPPPGMNTIPKARIEEGKGKSFELDSTSRNGPVLMVPAVGSK